MIVLSAKLENQVVHSRKKKLADAPSRDWLLQRLGEILEIAMSKLTGPKTTPEERIKWSRVVISAGQACNSVLRDVDIEALKKQIEELKALTLAKLSDEQTADQEGNTETSTDN